MKIRSITYFMNPGWPLDETALRSGGEFVQQAQEMYQQAGFEVQTVRLACPPFARLAPSLHVHELLRLAQDLENLAADAGFGYISLGPAMPSQVDSYPLIPQVIQETQHISMSGLMTLPGGGISLEAVRACARVIQQLSTIEPNGFTNLRFAALANVPGGSPFLPAAYHDSSGKGFAIATESAGLAVEAFSDAMSLENARVRLISLIERNTRSMEIVARSLEKLGSVFYGFDFSTAPFPQPALSIGTAMESGGLSAVGRHGTLAMAAIIADTLDQARFPRAGFNGLMLPVLEDTVLASRVEQGVLSVKDLLMCAAVCGTGLDTVALPGDTSEGQLAAVLLDVAALAQRLDKPLTARLMPIPGKRAGDPTSFEWTFFANSRVLGVEAEPLGGLLAGDENITLRPRLDRLG